MERYERWKMKAWEREARMEEMERLEIEGWEEDGGIG